MISKKLKEDPPTAEGDDDDVTVTQNSNTTTAQLSHLFASMMVSLQEDKEAAQAEAPLECLRRINEMFQPLLNKFKGKVWITPWGEDKITKTKLRTSMSTDDAHALNVAEEYLHDFNRFVSWGRRLYIRVHIVFLPSVSRAQLISQMALCKLKGDGGQFFQPAHSTSYDPVSGGTLTGSVPLMHESRDFYDTFKQRWQLKHLGLHWSYMRSKNGGAYSRNKNALHIEIDRSDENKLQDISSFFNQKSTAVHQQFWGTPMQWVPQWDFSLSDDDHERIDRNKTTQYRLGTSLKSCTVQGINLYNYTEPGKTLHRKLMELESIHEKFVQTRAADHTQSATRKSFKGRLFYAILPDSRNKRATFFYTSANSEEARSVARALPRFLESNLKLNPAAFCSRSFVAESKDGSWDSKTRKYLSEDELVEQEKLTNINDSMVAQREIYIDPQQQRALAADGDSIADTVDTKLTTGEEVAAPLENASRMSSITGSTRQSKVDQAVTAVSKQYMDKIQSLEQMLALMTTALQQTGIQLPNPPTQSNNPIHIHDDDECQADGWAFDNEDEEMDDEDPPIQVTTFNAPSDQEMTGDKDNVAEDVDLASNTSEDDDADSDDDDDDDSSHTAFSRHDDGATYPDEHTYGGQEAHTLLDSISTAIDTSRDPMATNAREEPSPSADADKEGSTA